MFDFLFDYPCAVKVNLRTSKGFRVLGWRCGFRGGCLIMWLVIALFVGKVFVKNLGLCLVG